MKLRKFFSITAALALVLTGLSVVAPTSAEAQVRTENRPNIFLVVGGVAVAALAVLLVAGGGGEGNQRPGSP